MEEVALQNLTKTRAAVSSHPELVGRAFLQIFITTTLHHRLAVLVGTPLRVLMVCSSSNHSLSKGELLAAYFIGLADYISIKPSNSLNLRYQATLISNANFNCSRQTRYARLRL